MRIIGLGNRRAFVWRYVSRVVQSRLSDITTASLRVWHRSALPYPEFVDELAGELFGDVEYGKSFYEHALCHSRAPCLGANHRMPTKGDQLTPAETALEKKDQRGWSSEEGRIR